MFRLINKAAEHLFYPYSPDLIEKRIVKYFNVASCILIVFTVIARVDDFFELPTPDRGGIFVFSWLFVLSFFFSFFHMFILPLAAIYFLFRKKFKNAALYIFSALFFLFFFMTLSNWDRF